MCESNYSLKEGNEFSKCEPWIVCLEIFCQKGYLDWSVPNENMKKFEKFEKKQNCDLLYVWNYLQENLLICH